jgi:glutamate-1-semialdehyde aminotransferase
MTLVAGYESIFDRYAARTPGSRSAHARAAQVLPGDSRKSTHTAPGQGVGSLLNIHATSHRIEDYRAAAEGDAALVRLLHLALLNEGVLIAPRGLACLSVPMSDGDCVAFLEAFDRALDAIGA